MSAVRSLTQHVSLTQTDSGLPLLKVDNAFARAEITLFGAHVLSYQRHGEAPLLWLSDKAIFDGVQPIRGGIPLCWPWFGPSPARVGLGKPSHGFARICTWTLDGVSDHVDGSLIHLSLKDSEQTRALWDHAFELELDILVGKELSLVMTTRNTGTTELVYNGALHTYLQIGAPEQVTVTGLGEPYFDKLSGAMASQHGPLAVDRAMDRIYKAPEAVIKVRDGDRMIEVINGGHDSAVVWNPWIENSAKIVDMSDDGYLTMLCVESTVTVADGLVVAPDEEHSLTTVIR
ncbi:MAG: D-hexose-6-phosphate mutarotase [Aeromonas sp.]